MLVSLGVACTKEQVTNIPEDPGTGTIEGTVYLDWTNVQVRGAIVSVGDISYKTGTVGQFLLQDVPAGKVTIRATHEKYEDYSTTRTVEADETIEVDLHMIPAHSSTVQGKVHVEATNTVIPNAIVQILNITDLTDKYGEFKLEEVPCVPLEIMAKKDGFNDCLGNVNPSPGETYVTDLAMRQIETNSTQIFPNSEVNGTTADGNKKYYIYIPEENIYVAIHTYYTDHNVLDLGVNLPSSLTYPATSCSADNFSCTNSGDEFVGFFSYSTPAFEPGKYYILVQKVGNGGDFTIIANSHNIK